MNLRIITQPDAEPVTLEQAKQNLRVDHTNDDTQIRGLIETARQQVERYTGIALMPQTREALFSCFKQINYLPYGPVQSITSIKYIDQAGDEQTMDSGFYRLTTGDCYDFFTVAPGKSYPNNLRVEGGIVCRYVAGYANADSVPAPLKQAILLLVNELYENRENSIVGQSYTTTRAFENLLMLYKRNIF